MNFLNHFDQFDVRRTFVVQTNFSLLLAGDYAQGPAAASRGVADQAASAKHHRDLLVAWNCDGLDAAAHLGLDLAADRGTDATTSAAATAKRRARRFAAEFTFQAKASPTAHASETPLREEASFVATEACIDDGDLVVVEGVAVTHLEVLGGPRRVICVEVAPAKLRATIA